MHEGRKQHQHLDYIHSQVEVLQHQLETQSPGARKKAPWPAVFDNSTLHMQQISPPRPHAIAQLIPCSPTMPAEHPLLAIDFDSAALPSDPSTFKIGKPHVVEDCSMDIVRLLDKVNDALRDIDLQQQSIQDADANVEKALLQKVEEILCEGQTRMTEREYDDWLEKKQSLTQRRSTKKILPDKLQHNREESWQRDIEIPKIDYTTLYDQTTYMESAVAPIIDKYTSMSSRRVPADLTSAADDQLFLNSYLYLRRHSPFLSRRREYTSTERRRPMT